MAAFHAYYVYPIEENVGHKASVGHCQADCVSRFDGFAEIALGLGISCEQAYCGFPLQVVERCVSMYRKQASTERPRVATSSGKMGSNQHHSKRARSIPMTWEGG